MTLSIGTRVRCTNSSCFKGTLGTIRDSHYESYRIQWDGSSDDVRLPNTHGGYWKFGAFEVVEDEKVDVNSDRIATLEAAVHHAEAVFEEYARQHWAKQTASSSFKAQVNESHAYLMRRALET